MAFPSKCSFLCRLHILIPPPLHLVHSATVPQSPLPLPLSFLFSPFPIHVHTFISIQTIPCLILCFDHEDILNAECPSRFVNFYWSRVDLEGRGAGGCWTSEIKSRPPGGAGELQLNSDITFTIIFVFHNIYLGINNIKSLLFITLV